MIKPGGMPVQILGMVRKPDWQDKNELTDPQGIDLPNIKIVIQFKATCDLCALWQRFGWAARGAGEEATAILLCRAAGNRRI